MHQLPTVLPASLSDNAINSFLKSKTKGSLCSLKCAIQSWHFFHHAWTFLIPDPRYFFSSYGSVRLRLAALSKSRASSSSLDFPVGALTYIRSASTPRNLTTGTPQPNDRGRFTQWFGSCSLMSTLYVWFPASWAPMVAERLFSWSPPSREFAYPQHGRPVSGPPQTTSRVHPWHQHSQGAAGSSEAMEGTDSTGEVQDQTMVITRCYNRAGTQRQQSSLLA